jgi:hypothetical protein
MSWPSNTSRWRIEGQDLAGPLGDRLIDVLGATPLDSCEEECPPVGATEGCGEYRALVLDPLQDFAAFADADHRALRGVRRLDPNGAFGVHADPVGAETLRPRRVGWKGCRQRLCRTP